MLFKKPLDRVWWWFKEGEAVSMENMFIIKRLLQSVEKIDESLHLGDLRIWKVVIKSGNINKSLIRNQLMVPLDRLGE